MEELADDLTLEEIIKKNCAIKEVKNEIEEMYEESMTKTEGENDLDYHKSEILANLCNILHVKLDLFRRLIDKYGGA